jgi:hypothetical protein
MGLDTTLNLITTITVIAGVTFAVFEVLHMGARRRQNAAFALVQSYETPEFAKAIVIVPTIPDGLSRRQLEEHLADDVDGVLQRPDHRLLAQVPAADRRDAYQARP